MEYLSHFTFGPALDVFRVGTQKFPNSSRQYLGLAFSHYAVREYPDAADAFTKALEIGSGFAGRPESLEYGPQFPRAQLIGKRCCRV